MLSSEDDIDLRIRQRNYGSRRRDGAGHDGRALCAPCYIVCFLLCLTKMKTRTRITLTWFYVIICACVSGGLVAKYHYRNELTASPGDMRKIDMVSATFCETVTVKSSAPINIIKFFKTPKIKNLSEVKYHRVSTSLNNLDEYQYWGFYLLKGSKMTAHVHVCGRAYLYKIVGKDKLDKWIAGSDRKSYDGSRVVNECTSDMYSPTVIEITATESAQYYLLFYNSLLSNEQLTNINVDFMLQRKYYGIFPNVSTIKCLASRECTVSLAPESKETVVYYVPDNEGMAEISVISMCKPRVYMYILIFGVLPFLIGSLFTCVIFKFARKRNRERERRESRIFTVSGNEDGSTNAFTNPNFHLQLSPPSYDEVQATSSAGFSDAPPSYDEAVRHSINNNCNHGNNDNNNKDDTR